MAKWTCNHCGCENERTARSPTHSAAFFAFLSYAFSRWPMEAKFFPENPEHLRSWALVEIGHQGIPLTWHFKNERERKVLMPFIIAEIEHGKRHGIYRYGREFGGGIAIVEAASINWEKVDQKKFNEIAAKVTHHIYHYAGIDWNKWIAAGSPRRFREAA
jgi:hypothetical protein